MATQVYHVTDSERYQAAGPSDLIELIPLPEQHPLFMQKSILESFVWAIVNHEFIHISGPTGSAKSSLIEALTLQTRNFAAIQRELSVPAGNKRRPKRVTLRAIEMPLFETPGELMQRRALREGATYDELSPLVEAIREAALEKNSIPVIWLREIGRTHSAAVQGGLLNLMTRGSIYLPTGEVISGAGITWIADSNYQAARLSEHTLVPFDDALRRRFSTNITLNYLPPEQELVALRSILNVDEFDADDYELVTRVVRLGHEVRKRRSEGQLRTVTPPTIPGYLTFVRMARQMPHLPYNQIADATLLGNASDDDQETLTELFSAVFSDSLSERTEELSLELL